MPLDVWHSILRCCNMIYTWERCKAEPGSLQEKLQLHLHIHSPHYKMECSGTLLGRPSIHCITDRWHWLLKPYITHANWTSHFGLTSQTCWCSVLTLDCLPRLPHSITWDWEKTKDGDGYHGNEESRARQLSVILDMIGGAIVFTSYFTSEPGCDNWIQQL